MKLEKSVALRMPACPLGVYDSIEACASGCRTCKKKGGRAIQDLAEFGSGGSPPRIVQCIPKMLAERLRDKIRRCVSQLLHQAAA